MGFTPQQKLVLKIIAAGLILLSMGIGGLLYDEVNYRHRDFVMGALIVTGVASFCIAHVVAGVFKLRK